MQHPRGQQHPQRRRQRPLAPAVELRRGGQHQRERDVLDKVGVRAGGDGQRAVVLVVLGVVAGAGGGFLGGLGLGAAEDGVLGGGGGGVLADKDLFVDALVDDAGREEGEVGGEGGGEGAGYGFRGGVSEC